MLATVRSVRAVPLTTIVALGRTVMAQQSLLITAFGEPAYDALSHLEVVALVTDEPPLLDTHSVELFHSAPHFLFLSPQFRAHDFFPPVT